MSVNFISSKDTGETCTIYVWSNNESIMWGGDTDDIIRELFRSFLHNSQEELKIISGSEFNFESIELMDYKLHRVRLRRGGSYVKSPEWLEQNNESIALNILFSSQNIEEITLLSKSEHNYNREK